MQIHLYVWRSMPKELVLHKFPPELRNPLTEVQQNIFKTTSNAGILTQDLFLGGVNAEPEHLKSDHSLEKKVIQFFSIVWLIYSDGKEMNLLVKPGQMKHNR